MSKNVEETTLSKATRSRLPRIKKGLLEGLTYDQIAKECHVCRDTIYRDIRDWVSTGDFDSWLDEEWLKLHSDVRREDPKEAYRQLTKLKLKRMKEHIEADVEAKIVVKAWDPDANNPN